MRTILLELEAILKVIWSDVLGFLDDETEELLLAQRGAGT